MNIVPMGDPQAPAPDPKGPALAGYVGCVLRQTGVI